MISTICVSACTRTHPTRITRSIVTPKNNLTLPIPQHKTQQFDAATLKPIPQPDAAPLLSGAFLINQQEVEALQERDRRQVCACLCMWLDD
jgi:hypothetical protein